MLFVIKVLILLLRSNVLRAIDISENNISTLEHQRYDGWYNNLAHPSWGSIDSHIIRRSPAAYSDGVYTPTGSSRPPALTVSELFMKGQDGIASLANRTVLTTFFGQMVVQEILQSSEAVGCPFEVIKIPISKCDNMWDPSCSGDQYMPMLRSSYDPETGQSPNNPRTQINKVTSWIDGSTIYNVKEAWTMDLRSFKNGELRTNASNNDLPLYNIAGLPLRNTPPAHLLKPTHVTRHFLLGDSRANQNPGILSMNILFYKYHNVVARRLHAKHPDWTDSQLFNKARRWVVGVLQNLILYEYLPALISEKIPAYKGYCPDVHPGISDVFQSAAFRFGHTTVPPGIYLRNAKCEFLKTAQGYDALRLCNTYWDAQETVNSVGGIEPIILGLASQLAEREDPFLSSDVREQLFGPTEFTRRDLAAVNIMRGRETGLPDYNTVRRAYGLQPVYNISQINPQLYAENSSFIDLLLLEYRSVNDIDTYIGGMLESENGRPGPLFRAVIKDQFLRIRDSDRFWFENRANGFFTDEEIQELNSMTLYKVIIETLDIAPEALQRNVLYWREGDPCRQPKQLNSSMLEKCIEKRTIDYFKGNEVAYIYTCILVASIPILTTLAAHLAMKFRRKKLRAQSNYKKLNGTSPPATQHARRLATISQEFYRAFAPNKEFASDGQEKIEAVEWLHHNQHRTVRISFGPRDSINIESRKSIILRRISLTNITALMIEVTQGSSRDPMVLIRIPKDYDLVLLFDTLNNRRKFISRAEQYLQTLDKSLAVFPTEQDIVYQTAETKERRRRKLERFFRAAYAHAFGVNHQRRAPIEHTKAAEDILQTKLSKSELADALGMRESHVFIEYMFAAIDRDRDGAISFKEFLTTVEVFSDGTVQDKLKILFDMVDHDNDGVISREEFREMLCSLIDMTKSKGDNQTMCSEMVLDAILESAGLAEKEKLVYDDFCVLLKDHMNDVLQVGLDCKGVKQNFLDPNDKLARQVAFQVDSEKPKESLWGIQGKIKHLVTFVEDHRRHIVIIVIYLVLCAALFMERFSYYMWEDDHRGLRKVMGLGIAVTRASAQVMAFVYSLMLLTVCRNIITRLKETSFNQYIPLDDAIGFHKLCAWTGGAFSVIHSIGHLVNFYHVSTQPLDHLQCLFPELETGNTVPTFFFYVYETLTGATGVLLVIVACIMYSFAVPEVRRNAYRYFWVTHQLYLVFFTLCLLHGLPRLVATPRFWWFFIGPAILFFFDRLWSMKQRHLVLEVFESRLLPSDVTFIKFMRPPDFQYKSGQWIRFACDAVNPGEYHSFTLTSAPHQPFLSVHVKSLGLWTQKLREVFDSNNIVEPMDFPNISVEGPFGGGNQDWYKFEVCVMVGGGIGVTPYASILNDLVFGTSTNRYSGVACRKVYFVWVTPSHKSFEWFVDVLHEIEKKDVTRVLENHIFVTQFFHKFDLRTTMLYICENHFQKFSRRSLFTGLRAVNHFGRPHFPSFFRYVKHRHPEVSHVGVFSCGPNVLTNAVLSGCETVNKDRNLPHFIHHMETF